MSSPPTNVAHTGSAKKTRTRAAHTPSPDGGGAPNDAPPASTQPRLIPRAGAATRPPNHWKRPTASTTDFMPVTGRAATRLMRASLAMATMAPLQNSFAVLDSANNVGTAIMDGNEDDKATDNIMTANDSDVKQGQAMDHKQLCQSDAQLLTIPGLEYIDFPSPYVHRLRTANRLISA